MTPKAREAPVLVEDLSEVTPGLRVLGTNCTQCHGDHVGTVGAPEPSVWFPGTTAFKWEPQPKCIPPGRVGVIDFGGVVGGNLYRFVRLP